MIKHALALAALAGSAAVTFAATPADAQVRRERHSSVQTSTGRGVSRSAVVEQSASGRTRQRSVQTNSGRGYESNASVQREEGARQAERSVQTNDGRGVTTSQSASWSDGSYSGGRTTTTNNGTTMGRNTNITNNGDGTTSYQTEHYGPAGTVTREGTVTRQP